MTSTLLAATAAPPRTDRPPSLANGDHLTREEFECRYAAMPGVKKAELVEGVVHMPTPVRSENHSDPHFDLVTWLGAYRAASGGVRGGDNATVRLDLDNEPQPDALLRIDPELGGQARIDEDDYLEGAPELVAEVAASSASYDLHEKLNVYRRNGVQEYVVWRVQDRALDWFVLRHGEYVRMELDAAGLYRSDVFPGLWLDAAALVRGDLATVLQRLQEGLASEEHMEFVKRLRGAGGTD